MRVNINKDEFIKVCQESMTASEAARKLNLHFNTFKRYAVEFGCYTTNQGRKGIKTGPRSSRIPIKDILDGKYPDYQTYKLKMRLIDEGIKEDKCELCGWCGHRDGEAYSTCELHHIDGNSRNHTLENLILLCPNCHSLTDNYRSKNRASCLKKQEGMQANSSNSIVNEELSEE